MSNEPDEIDGITEVIHVMDAKTYDTLLALATILRVPKLDLLLTRIVECTVTKGMINFPDEP